MQSEVTQLPLTHRLWAWFETNRKQALWGAAAAFVFILVIALLVWRHGEKAAVAGEAFSIVASPLPGASSPNSAQAYLRIANEYSGTQAAIRAQLMAAATLFADGKFDEARVQFERLRERRDRRFTGQALLGIGACLHAQGKTNEALTAYKTVIDTQPGENVLPQAKFSLASLYEATGKAELALGLFEDLARTDPYGSLGSEAGMRLEELRKQHPELVLAPTNTPALTPMTIPTTPLAKP